MRFLNYGLYYRATLGSSSEVNFIRVSRILTDKTSTTRINSIRKKVRKRFTRAVRILLITGILSCSNVAFAAETSVTVNPTNSTDEKSTKFIYKILKNLLLI